MSRYARNWFRKVRRCLRCSAPLEMVRRQDGKVLWFCTDKTCPYSRVDQPLGRRKARAVKKISIER